MKTHTVQHHRGRGRAAGFSLVEVLIAMGIFAVGFVSVAAMFPAGALLQKETIADVESQLVARNAAAIVRSKKLTFSPTAVAPTSSIDLVKDSGDGTLQPFLSALGINPKASPSLKQRYRLGDRGYPTAQQTVDDRKYYWVPLLRRTLDPVAEAAGDFLVVVFVLRRDGQRDYSYDAKTWPTTPTWASATTTIWANLNTAPPAGDGPKVPKVIGIKPTTAAGSTFTFQNRVFASTPALEADQVRVGDWIADNNGQVYTVVAADNAGCTVAGSIMKTENPANLKIWFAPPPAPAAPSPCTRVLLLTGVIEQKN